MKTIVIETVNKGWIVRPFSSSANFNVCDKPDMTVYISIEDLKKDLPELLEITPVESSETLK